MRGIRKSSQIITVAAATTPETLYIQSTGGTIARTVILRKVMCFSPLAVGNVYVDIGTGLAAAFVNIIPTIFVVSGFHENLMEWEIPEVEVNGDLTVQADVLGVMVQVEVEEVGS
ncbi:MAG: hypothetical protein WAO71_03605 [Gallionella sp.]